MYSSNYAQEAGKRCITYAKETLKAQSLVSYIAPQNQASKNVADSLGAAYESTIELLCHGQHSVYRYY